MKRLLPLVVLLAACTSSPGKSPDDLHGVDWQRATVTADFCGVEGPVTLQEGKAQARSTTWGEVDLWLDSRQPVSYGDVDADGRDEAALSMGCGTESSQLAFGFVVVRAANGNPEIIGEISTTTMRDDAPHVPMLTEPRFEKGAITVKELWYRPADANCCPTGASLTRWWLRDGTLKADPAVQVS
ncbi:hypothetical protein ACIA8G_01800 [Lentzea sp. NPDC051213]|uniref:hypothetical protein n=1 Tax=Lentzea sp. NPDC051213 TaxID=3364126 RepID=UPI00379A8446